jgi:hypothetical protein
MTKFTSDLLHSILPPPMVFPRGLAADLCSLSPIPNVGEVDGGSFLQGSNFRSVHCQCPQAQPDRARNLYRIALSLGRLPDKIERVNTEATKTRIDASSSTPRVFSTGLSSCHFFSLPIRIVPSSFAVLGVLQILGCARVLSGNGASSYRPN